MPKEEKPLASEPPKMEPSRAEPPKPEQPPEPQSEAKPQPEPGKPVAEPPKKVVYTFASRDAVLKDFDMIGGWDVHSNDLVLTGQPRSKATSKAVFSFPISIEYQMCFLPDRPYDLFPGFAGIHLYFATVANTRTDLVLGGECVPLPHKKGVPNHLYRIVFIINRDRTLIVKMDGKTIFARNLHEQVSLEGPVCIGESLGHVVCRRIIIRADPPAEKGKPTGRAR